MINIKYKLKVSNANIFSFCFPFSLFKEDSKTLIKNWKKKCIITLKKVFF